MTFLQANHKQQQHEISEHPNKSIEHDPSKPITINIRERGADKYEKAHIKAIGIRSSKRQDHQPPFKERSLD